MEETDSVYTVPLLANSITQDDIESDRINRRANMEIDHPYAIHEDERDTVFIDKKVVRSFGCAMFVYINVLLYIIYRYKN